MDVIEYPTPPEVIGYPASKQRPDNTRQENDGGEGTQPARALLRWKDVRNEDQGQRLQDTGTQTLNATKKALSCLSSAFCEATMRIPIYSSVR